jgi:hypothetical protein
MVHIKVNAILCPSYDDIASVLAAMMTPDKNVYVHCKEGVDRTGCACACYRVREQGWAPDAAITEMYAMGFHKFPYLFWVPTLRKVMVD